MPLVLQTSRDTRGLIFFLECSVRKVSNMYFCTSLDNLFYECFRNKKTINTYNLLCPFKKAFSIIESFNALESVGLGKQNMHCRRTQKGMMSTAFENSVHNSREAIFLRLNTSGTTAKLYFVLHFTWRGLDCRREEQYVPNTI